MRFCGVDYKRPPGVVFDSEPTASAAQGGKNRVHQWLVADCGWCEMSGRTALEIADDLDTIHYHMETKQAAAKLRAQHAEIARLQANMTAMTLERDIRVMTEARNAELHAEIARLTDERDAAIAAAVDAEREACAAVCESEADKSVGWAKVRMIEMANRMRRDISARAMP
ncbi:MAG: hypothetical protein KBE22_16665 [Candidatus Accumulibacter sp.]|nr:hypothetical protein [Accumulibacter sp.]